MSESSMELPDDQLLSPQAVRRRKRSRHIAAVMLSIAVGTAIVGWGLFSSSVLSAIKIKEQPPSLAIVAYGLLILSSITLVLGLWYLLLAQVERLARIVEDTGSESVAEVPATECPACRWPCDPPDHFCRHCGKPLKAGEVASGH